MKHLVFYDGSCGLCHRAVQWILKADKKRLFCFTPLQGQTAALLLDSWKKAHPEADTLVLMENYQETKKSIYAFGQGALRIGWLIGGIWAIFGLISFLPPFLYNWIYRLVASRRFLWFKRESCLIPQKEDQTRFLP